MTIEAAMRERLLSLSSVSTLVSTRVYQDLIPQGATMPAVRIQRIGKMRRMHLRGVNQLWESRVQVDTFGATKASAQAVADAVSGDGLGSSASGLEGFTGDLGGSPPDVHVAVIVGITERAGFEPEELKLFRISQDYRVIWWELT
jgi:hypothetical protein